MKSILYCNLTKGTVSDSKDGAEYHFRTAVAGEVQRFGLRFVETVDGVTVETHPEILSIQLSVGRQDARPLGGKIAYQFGPGPSTAANTTASLPWNHNAAALRAALPMAVLNTHGLPVAADVPGGVTLTFENQVLIRPRSNTLWPLSFLRSHAWEIPEGGWLHDLRMVQAPLVQTTAYILELPPAPSVATIRDGGADMSGTWMWSEIQELTVPVSFRGSYHLRNPETLARTDLLSPDDGAEEIAAALATIYPTGHVKVTNPGDQIARLEWLGDYMGADLAPVEIFVDSAPPGDPTLTLDFRLASIYAALREEETYGAQVEARAVIARTGAPEGEPLVLFRSPISIARDQNWDGMSEQVTPLWLRPPNPVDYVPYTEDQVLIGSTHYRAVIGDGTATAIVVDHNLDSEDITAMTVRENTAPGDLVTDWSAVVTSKNFLTLHFPTAPALNSLVVNVTAAGQVSAFQAHTHTQEQILGLVPLLENLATRVGTLENILPTVTVGVVDATVGSIEIPIPETTEALFYRGDEKLEIKDGKLPTTPRRAPSMLPAIHTAAAATSLPAPLPVATGTTPGTLWINDSGAPVIIPGGGGLRSSWVAANGFVGGDGHAIYPVTRDGATNSYFPSAFERELFAFFVSEKMLASRRMELVFGVSAALINASSRASWLLEIQAGTAPQDTTPATTGPNLQNIVWNVTPILRERLVLTQELVTHTFGCRIKQTQQGMVCDVQNYGLWTGNNAAAPTTPAFVLRARLINFDTENSRPEARGWVLYQLTGASADGKLKAIIT